MSKARRPGFLKLIRGTFDHGGGNPMGWSIGLPPRGRMYPWLILECLAVSSDVLGFLDFVGFPGRFFWTPEMFWICLYFRVDSLWISGIPTLCVYVICHPVVECIPDVIWKSGPFFQNMFLIISPPYIFLNGRPRARVFFAKNTTEN